MDEFLFSINAVVPVFAVVFFGVFLRWKSLINEDFVGISTGLVFKFALPALLFTDIAATDFKSVFDIKLILYSLAATAALFLLLTAVCPLFIKDKRSAGAFIQGAFRGNFAFLGLPLAFNLFGQEGGSKAGIVLSFVVPLYNVLAIILLTVMSPNLKKGSLKAILLNIVKNPLIIAVAAAVPFSYFNIPLPGLVEKSMGYVAGLSMPLALIGMGGSFSLSGLKSNISKSLAATFLKILAAPALFTALAYYMGFRSTDLGVLFVLFSSPTAITSYIMARAMDSDFELASQIVILSTLGSTATIITGVYLLKNLGAI